MTALSENFSAEEQRAIEFAPLVKDAEIIYCGSIVAMNLSTAEAETAKDAASLMVIGRSEEEVDNTDDGLRCRVRSGVFRWNNSATNPVAAGAKIAYIEDDNTISSDPGNNSIVVPVVDVDDDGVWIDTRRFAVLAAMGLALPESAFSQAALVTDPAAPAALTGAAPDACAAMTTDLTGVDTGTDMTAAQAGQIVADLTALKNGIDANNAAIDANITDIAALRTAIVANKAAIDGLIDALQGGSLMATE